MAGPESKIPHPSDFHIDEGLITEFEKRRNVRNPDIAQALLESDEALALFIKREAERLFPGEVNLNARGHALELAREVAHVFKSQIAVNALLGLLEGRDVTAADIAQGQLPPAA